jgi:hypothetical protein
MDMLPIISFMSSSCPSSACCPCRRPSCRATLRRGGGRWARCGSRVAEPAPISALRGVE